VLADGRIIRARSDVDASEEEKDIMFALQGGGGNFGAVTEFKVKVVKTPTNIYTGRVFYSLDQVRPFCSVFQTSEELMMMMMISSLPSHL
jgi:FAD/FMN-containing dehydrogenase